MIDLSEGEIFIKHQSLIMTKLIMIFSESEFISLGKLSDNKVNNYRPTLVYFWVVI